MLTPLAKYEGAIGSTEEITIDWNAFRELWLPLLKGPLANLYRIKVLHTGENARAGDERVIVETLQNREARLNANEEDRAVIDEGIAIADRFAESEGLPMVTDKAAQLTYEQHKRLMYHQHYMKMAELEKRSAHEEKKRKQELDALAEQSHQENIRSRDAGLLEQLNAERHRLRRAETRIEQLEQQLAKVSERAEGLQQTLDAKQRFLSGLRELIFA